MCSALDLSGLDLDTELEVSDNEDDNAAAQTFASMVARDDALETHAEVPGPSLAFVQQPPRRLAHSQSTPANMTCARSPPCSGGLA